MNHFSELYSFFSTSNRNFSILLSLLLTILLQLLSSLVRYTYSVYDRLYAFASICKTFRVELSAYVKLIDYYDKLISYLRFFFEFLVRTHPRSSTPSGIACCSNPRAFIFFCNFSILPEYE